MGATAANDVPICDGCHTRCRLDEFQCGRGRARYEAWLEKRLRDDDTPVCPGCHFGCRVGDYQCARGEKLLARWEAGEELPERRMPGPGGRRPSARRGPGGPAGRPPFDGKPEHDLLAMLFPLVSARILMSRGERPAPPAAHGDPAIAVLTAIARHEGAATAYVIGGRSGMTEKDARLHALDLASDGLLDAEEYADGTVLFRIADPGRSRLDAHEAQQSSANAKFFEALSADEQKQLHALIDKLLGM